MQRDDKFKDFIEIIFLKIIQYTLMNNLFR